MEVSLDAFEELSDGNYVCKLCASYLTLGKNEDIKRDNLHIHFNGRRHRFRSRSIGKSFFKTDDSGSYPNEFCSFVGNFYHGIFNDININFNLYCSFCDCVLPQLSKDRQSNILNIFMHSYGRRHNFNVLWIYAKHVNIEDECCNAFDSINFEPYIQTPDFYSSITSSFYSTQNLSLENIFSEVPDRLRDHRNVINFDEKFCKFSCSLCKCAIAFARNKVTTVKNILLHLEGRKHVHLCYHNNEKDNLLFHSDEAEDENLMKVLKMTKNKVIDKNQIFIGRNTYGNTCKLCKCMLPDIGKNGYLLGIKNFEIHFFGRRHKRNLKNHLQQRVNKIVMHGNADTSEKCDEIISRILNELPKNLPKDTCSPEYFMISKSSNLICKLCSCVIIDNIELCSDRDIVIQIEKHIRMVKHGRNYLQKESMKYYNAVTSNIAKRNNNSSCDYVQSIIKLDSCGQFVCSLCCRVIIKPNDYDMEVAVLSHLKGRKHKNNDNNIKNIARLTENVLTDIINSLPGNFKRNKKYLNFIFKYGIVHCIICNYMFTACNNFRLRNNLMIHLTSTRHNYLVNASITNGSDSNDDDYTDSDCWKMMDNDSLASVIGNELNVKGIDDEDYNQLHGGIDSFCDSDFSELLDAGSEIFFHHLFKNYIPSDLHYNENYLSLKSKELYCLACNCSLVTPLRFSAAVQILMNHFIEPQHKKIVKKLNMRDFLVNPTVNQKKFTVRNLIHIFKNHIPASMRNNEEHIIITSNNLFCNICQCNLLETGNSNEKIISKLKTHFKTKKHNDKSSNLRNLDEKSAADKLVLPPVMKSNKSQDVSLQIDHVECNHRKLFDEDDKSLDKDNDNRSCSEIYSSFYERNFADRLRNIFKNNIPASMRCNKEHIKIVSHKLYCDRCQCDLIHSRNSDNTIVNNLKLHFKSKAHCNNTSNLKLGKDASVKKSAVDKSEQYLDNLFTHFIPADFKYNRPYFYVKSNVLVCSICDCSLPKSSNPQGSAKNVKDHLKGFLHKSNLKTQKNKGLISERDFTANDSKNNSNVNDYNSSPVDEKYLEDLFNNFIPSNLKFNRPYLSLKSNQLVCKICRCVLSKAVKPEGSAGNLIQHLKGYYHKSSLKTNKKAEGIIANKSLVTNEIQSNCKVDDENSSIIDNNYLEKIFTHFIPSDLKFNRPYLFVKSNKLLCDVCGCIILANNATKSVDPQSSAKNVVEHLRSCIHGLNLKYRENEGKDNRKASQSSTAYTLEENRTFLENVLVKFVPLEFQFNREFITIESGILHCSICNLSLFRPVSPEITGHILGVHLKGHLHRSNLATKSPFMSGEKLVCKIGSSPNIMGNSDINSVNKCKGNDNTFLDTLSENYVDNFCSKFKVETVNTYNSSAVNGAFLDSVFKSLSGNDFVIDQQFVSLRLNILYCDLCNCKIGQYLKPPVAAKQLLEHFKGKPHKKNLCLLGDARMRNQISDDYHTKSTPVHISPEASESEETIFSDSDHSSQKSYSLLEEETYSNEYFNCLEMEKKYGCSAENDPVDDDKYLGNVLFDYSFPNFTENQNMNTILHEYTRENLSLTGISNTSSSSSKNTDPLSDNLYRKSTDIDSINEIKSSNSSSIDLDDPAQPSYIHHQNIVKKPYVLDKSPANVNGSCRKNEKFLDLVFENFIPSEFQHHHLYFSIDQDMLFCTVCDCPVFKHDDPQLTAKIVMMHLNGGAHEKNLETTVYRSWKNLDGNAIYNSANNFVCENKDIFSDVFKKSTDIDVSNELKSIDSSSLDSDDPAQPSNIQQQRIYEKPYELDKSSANVNSSCGKNKKYLEEVFLNFIAHDIRFNRQYISIKSNQLFCNICDCSLSMSVNHETTSKNLTSHLRGYYHLTNLNGQKRSSSVVKNAPVVESFKKNDILDHVFTFLIPLELQSDRQYFLMESGKFFCSLCCCQISIPVIPEVAANILIEHLTGQFHESNLVIEITSNCNSKSYSSTVTDSSFVKDDELLDSIFKDFILKDLEFNKQYLTVKMNKILCQLCGCSVSKSRDFQSTACNLIQHLKGRYHRSNL